MEFPVAIYLETTVLRGLPIEIADASFLELRSLCERLKIPMLVPQLCVDELIYKRKGDVRDAVRKVSSGVAHVARYLDGPPTLDWGKDEEHVLGDVGARVQKYLNDNGLTIIPTPNVPLERLLKMAVEKIKPFEEKGEKGFRDSVILFTVLEYATAHANGYHLLLSGDGIFEHTDVMAQATKAGVDLRVAESVAGAVEHLRHFVTAAVKEYLRLRSQVLKNFLLQHTGEIEQYIHENGEFTSNYLLSDEGPFASLTMRVQAIENLQLIDVENAQPGDLPAGATEGRIQVSFGAKVKFTLAVTILPPPRGPTFRVRRAGQPADTAGTASELLSVLILHANAQDEQVSRREITKTVGVVGSAFVKGIQEYSDLELSSVGGSSVVDALLGAAYRAGQ